MGEEVERGRHDKATQAGDKSRGRKSRAAGERETCRMRGSGREERRREWRGAGGEWREGRAGSEGETTDFKDRQRIEDRTTRHERKKVVVGGGVRQKRK